MSDEQELFIKDDTGDGYVAYTPPSFTDTIPEDLRGQVGEIANVGDLAKGYVDLKSNVPVVPEAPDKYDISLPEGGQVDNTAIDAFKPIAHELGLTNAQLNAIIKFDLERGAKYEEQFQNDMKAEREASEKALQERWGTHYDFAKERAGKGLTMLLGSLKDGEEIKKRLTEKGMMNDPDLLVLMEAVGSKVSEDVFTVGQSGASDDEIPRGPDGRPILTYPSMKK